MIPMLLTDAERRRVEQIDVHVSSGAPGVYPLLAMLDDPSWTVRRAVTSSLAALGDDAVPALCRWLIEVRSSEAGIAAAIDALVASLSQRVPEAVNELLAHPAPAIAADGAIILGRARASTAVPALVAMLDHADDNVAMAAIEALGTIGGGTVVEPLIAVLERRNFFRTFPALHVLATTGDPRAVDAIAKLLDDPLYRDEAVRALGRTGSQRAIAAIASVFEPANAGLIARALADLLELARWSGSEAQVTAELIERFGEHRQTFLAALPDDATIAVLGAIGDADTAPVLAELIEHPQLQAAARRALEQCARRLPEVIAVLCSDSGPRTRAFGLELINARTSIAPALAALADPDADVRARACAALAKLGAVEAVPGLFELLADSDPRVPHAASVALDSLGSAEARVLASHAARSDNPQVRRHGLRIAGYLGVPDAFELVLDALASDDARVRASAISLLGVVDHPGAAAKLSELALDADEQTRVAATRAAARRGGAEMAAVLERSIADDSAWVRYHACQGLGLAGDPATAPLLISRLADSMPHVRIAAIEALARLRSPLAWQTLCSFAKSDDPEQQRVALAGLALHDADAALDYLLSGLESPDLATRLVAISGLATAKSPAALAAIARTAAGSSSETRDAAVSLLAERTDAPAARALIELAITTPVEHPARTALAQPSEARVTAIGDRLATADLATAQRLCSALGAMGEQAGAIAVLFAQLASPNPAARRASASVLTANRIAAAAPVISRLAHDDPDPEVRAICAVLGAR